MGWIRHFGFGDFRGDFLRREKKNETFLFHLDFQFESHVLSLIIHEQQVNQGLHAICFPFSFHFFSFLFFFFLAPTLMVFVQHSICFTKSPNKAAEVFIIIIIIVIPVWKKITWFSAGSAWLDLSAVGFIVRLEPASSRYITTR